VRLVPLLASEQASDAFLSVCMHARVASEGTALGRGESSRCGCGMAAVAVASNHHETNGIIRLGKEEPHRGFVCLCPEGISEGSMD